MREHTSYNYYKVVTEDIKNYISENMDMLNHNFSDLEEVKEYLNNELWRDDDITGNMSGSYILDSEIAKEYVFDNIDLLISAIEVFREDYNILRDFERCDVIIRCYILSECIDRAVDEIVEECNDVIDDKTYNIA